jgi:ClpP class serine protease
VDELGGLAEAQAEAAKLAKLDKDYDVQYIEKPMSAFEQIFLDMSRSARLSAIVRNMGPMQTVFGSEATERVQKELSWLQPQRGASPIRAVAHCLCDF